MFQMAAAFGGGLIARSTFDGVQMPHLRCSNGVPAFKLSVRFVAASVPNITAPGLISQRRPFVDVSLGSSRKETEFADFDAECCLCEEEEAPQCPWRFGDALTFKPSMEDVMGPGLQLTLRVRQDVGLGPLQLDLGDEVVGSATVDLRRRALPACIGSANAHKNGDDLMLGASTTGTWMSPLMLVPLAAACDSGTRSVERPLSERAMLAVFFAVDVDPEAVLETVETRAQLLDGLGQAARRLGEACGGLARWFDEAADRGEGMCAALKLAAPGRLCRGEDNAEEDAASTCMPHSAESSQASPGSSRTSSETRSVEACAAAPQHTHCAATYPPAEVDAFRVFPSAHNVKVALESPCMMQGIAKMAAATPAPGLSRGAGGANAAVATGLPVEAVVRPPVPAPELPQQSTHSHPFQVQPPCFAWSTSQSRALQLLHGGALDLGRPRNNAVPDLGQPRALPAVSAAPADSSLSPPPPLSPPCPGGQTGGPALAPAQRPVIPEEVAC